MVMSFRVRSCKGSGSLLHLRLGPPADPAQRRAPLADGPAPNRQGDFRRDPRRLLGLAAQAPQAGVQRDRVVVHPPLRGGRLVAHHLRLPLFRIETNKIATIAAAAPRVRGRSVPATPAVARSTSVRGNPAGNGSSPPARTACLGARSWGAGLRSC